MKMEMNKNIRSSQFLEDASYLLPDPGGEVVRGLIRERDAARAERDAAVGSIGGVMAERDEANRLLDKLERMICVTGDLHLYKSGAHTHIQLDLADAPDFHGLSIREAIAKAEE